MSVMNGEREPFGWEKLQQLSAYKSHKQRTFKTSQLKRRKDVTCPILNTILYYS